MEQESFAQVEALVRLFRERQLQELKVEDGAFKLHLRRALGEPPAIKGNPQSPPIIPPVAKQVSPDVRPPAARQGKGRTVAVRSPLIGVFYRSSSPDAAPFVTIGDVVSEGQTVCIVEAMKVFNEIKAEWNGRVVATPVEEGDLVHAGDPLIVLEFVDNRAEEED